MKKTLRLILLAVFIGAGQSAISQNEPLKPNEFLMMHYYTFQGSNATQEKLDAMEQSLAKLALVVQAKIKYKFEKNQGQVILVVKEKSVSTEGEKGFSPTSIKQTILKNGFAPMEYTTGKYEN